MWFLYLTFVESFTLFASSFNIHLYNAAAKKKQHTNQNSLTTFTYFHWKFTQLTFKSFTFSLTSRWVYLQIEKKKSSRWVSNWFQCFFFVCISITALIFFYQCCFILCFNSFFLIWNSSFLFVALLREMQSHKCAHITY